MRTQLLASVLVLSSVLAASSVSAQDPAAPPATAPAPAAAPTAAPPPATPPPAAPLSDEDADAKGRLWIGFNVGGGVGTGANISGPAFDGSFRAGWVLNHLMGVYGNLTGLVWVGSATSASSNGGSASLGAIAGWLITPMFALTPVDLLEVAVGPSLDFLSGGSTSASGSAGGGSAGGSASASAFSGAYFGAQGRVALHLGGRNEETRRRRGFTLSLDVHPSFVSGGPVTFITGGLGADWF